MFARDMRVGAPYPALEVGHHPVDVGKDLHRGGAVAHGQRPDGQFLGGGAIAGQTVGEELSLVRDLLPEEALDLVGGYGGHPPQGRVAAALRPRLHGHQHRHLGARPPAPLAGLLAAADVGVVHLDEPLEGVVGIPAGHGLADLVAPAPGRGVGQPQVMLDLAGGGAGGAGGHQVDRPEPIAQRLVGLVEDGVGGHRGLMAAAPALVFAPRGDQVGLVMVAARAAETLGPLALDDVAQAVALGAETPAELLRGHGGIHGSPP